MAIACDSIETVIESIRGGHAVIVVDTNPDCSYGGFVMAARHVTVENLSLFLTQGPGFLAVALDQSICLKFGLRPLEPNESTTQPYVLPFSIRQSHISQSLPDQVKAIKAVVNPDTTPSEVQVPGYVHPVLTTQNGVLTSPNLAPASTDLVRLAGLEPAAVIIEILDQHGELARLQQLSVLAKQLQLKMAAIEDLVNYLSDN